MGPPSRSFAADAHDCIMVWIRVGPPNTRVWRDVPPLMASSPPIITQKPWSRRGTVGKNSQQGELIIDDSKNHTRPAERTNGSTSNHLTPKAPYKPALAKAGVGELVLPATERSGPIEAWIIDDTGFPKKGRHSVGVTRQYCGQLGKQDNCQVAVSLSLANHDVSLPIAYRLYLPADWAKDQARRDKAKVPQTVALAAWLAKWSSKY